MKSIVTDRIYDPLEMIYISNPIQTSLYMEKGATLYDVLADNKTLTFVFSKNETYELYHQWKKRELG